MFFILLFLLLAAIAGTVFASMRFTTKTGNGNKTQVVFRPALVQNRCCCRGQGVFLFHFFSRLHRILKRQR